MSRVLVAEDSSTQAELLRYLLVEAGFTVEIAPDGQLFIRGRKKEMIVTPEGLNVFPEDVERVLNHVPGVRDSAVVGVSNGSDGSLGRRTFNKAV